MVSVVMDVYQWVNVFCGACLVAAAVTLAVAICGFRAITYSKRARRWCAQHGHQADSHDIYCVRCGEDAINVRWPRGDGTDRPTCAIDLIDGMLLPEHNFRRGHPR